MMKSVLVKFLIFLLLAFYITPSNAFAGQSSWRDYYSRTYLVEALKIGTTAYLMGYGAAAADINKAVEFVKDGKGQEAVKELMGSTSDESIFIKGLIYEVMGFYPEAVGNYARLIQFYPDGKFFRKANIRSAFIKLINGLKTDSIPLVKEASRGFYDVYKKSDEPEEWKDAIAGYAITLYILDEGHYAQEVFKKIEGYISLNPSYQFFAAENYVKIGKVTEARVLFQKLAETQKGSGIIPYINLRLGDIALLENNDVQAELFYKGVQEHAKSPSDTGTSEASGIVNMGTMALAESYMKKGKNSQAIKLLKDLLEKSIDVRVNDSADYYLIKLLKSEGGLQEALLRTRKFLASYPMSLWKKDVEKVRDDIIYRAMADAYQNANYQKVAKYYYENKGVIKDDRLVEMAGDSFLNLNLPREAEVLYKSLMNRKTINASIGLAKSLIMGGDAKRTLEIINRVSASKGAVKTELAEVYHMLGDHYFRVKGYDDALKAYSLAYQNGMTKPELHFKIAHIYELLGKKNDAAKVYESLADSVSNEVVKTKAFLKLGDIYYTSKDWDSALSFYAKGVQFVGKGEERFRFIYRMGEANMNIGKRKEAVEAWQEVERDDKGYMGRLAHERLKEVNAWQTLQM